VETGELKILLGLEPTWTVSRNGIEFQTIRADDIAVESQAITLGKWHRRLVSVEWLRPNVVKIRTRQKLRAEQDVFTLYPGSRLPSSEELRRRRRSFARELAPALSRYFGCRLFHKETLCSDRHHGIGGAYPRFILDNRAIIAVDPDESTATVNAVMRAALLWSRLLRRRVSVVIPEGRASTVRSRLTAMRGVHRSLDWFQWDGNEVSPLAPGSPNVETEVHDFKRPDVDAQVLRISAGIPFPLQPMLNIAGRAVSLRFRGIEVALIREDATLYPLGEPVQRVVEELAAVRRHGSTHALARAHEERWLESNVVEEMGRLLPSIDSAHIYPQVPSFVGEERNIIDILTVTSTGRLVVMEIKASADPDLPFQALDYWIAVERHRKAGDFHRKGYFQGVQLKDQPALLVLVAPLLSFHKTLNPLVGAFSQEVPLIQIGLNQTWKKEIKILRRRGLVS
jgi:hypothetical protein